MAAAGALFGPRWHSERRLLPPRDRGYSLHSETTAISLEQDVCRENVRLGRFLSAQPLPGHLPNAPTPPRRFVAPQGAVARSAPRRAEKAASSVSVAQVGQAAAATTLLAALPANAFSAAYLPAILVPVMCLVMPVLGMGLFTILTQKEEL